MKDTLAIVAALIAIGGYIPYFRDVLRKRVTPHPYTWLVWSIVSGITFFGQLAKGAGIGVLPTAVAEAFTIAVFVYSLRYGFKNVIKSDNYFGIFICFSEYSDRHPDIHTLFSKLLGLMATVGTWFRFTGTQISNFYIVSSAVGYGSQMPTGF